MTRLKFGLESFWGMAFSSVLVCMMIEICWSEVYFNGVKFVYFGLG